MRTHLSLNGCHSLGCTNRGSSGAGGWCVAYKSTGTKEKQAKFRLGEYREIQRVREWELLQWPQPQGRYYWPPMSRGKGREGSSIHTQKHEWKNKTGFSSDSLSIPHIATDVGKKRFIQKQESSMLGLMFLHWFFRIWVFFPQSFLFFFFFFPLNFISYFSFSCFFSVTFNEFC